MRNSRNIFASQLHGNLHFAQDWPQEWDSSDASDFQASLQFIFISNLLVQHQQKCLLILVPCSVWTNAWKRGRGWLADSPWRIFSWIKPGNAQNKLDYFIRTKAGNKWLMLRDEGIISWSSDWILLSQTGWEKWDIGKFDKGRNGVSKSN